jgi:hypothetical protein
LSIALELRCVIWFLDQHFGPPVEHTHVSFSAQHMDAQHEGMARVVGGRRREMKVKGRRKRGMRRVGEELRMM